MIYFFYFNKINILCYNVFKGRDYMKKNGFTFVELLTMLAVLGILMLIAIPNINGILKNQRLNMIKGDATNMVETAKIKSRKERLLTKPKSGECIIFALNYLLCIEV